MAVGTLRPVAVAGEPRPHHAGRTVGHERLAVEAEVEATAVERVSVLAVDRRPTASRSPRTHERLLLYI